MVALSTPARIRSCVQRLFLNLAPIQMGEKEAGEILIVTREESDMYFAAEDEAVTMAECQMM